MTIEIEPEGSCLGATGGTGRDRPRRPGERLSWINGRHRHPIGSPQPKGTPTPTELLAQVHFAYHSATGALTARSDEVDRIVGLELGADDYLPKPFSPHETDLQRLSGGVGRPCTSASSGLNWLPGSPHCMRSS